MKKVLILSNARKKIFRDEALEQLNVSKQLYQRLNIVSTSSWIIFYAVALISITLVFYGFFGSIPTRVPGNGILLATKGSLYNAVAPEGNGRIVSIVIKPGDLVTKNQVVAYLDDPELEEKVNVAQGFLTKLQGEYNALKDQYAQEFQTNTQQIEEQNKILHHIIDTNTEKLTYFTGVLETKKLAFKRGLITQDSVAITAQVFYETKDAINNAQNTLEENALKQSNFISIWKDRLNTLKLKVEDQEYQLNDLKVRLSGAKAVKSPIQGVVTFVQASIGEKEQGGQVVATIATLAKDLDAVVYVPAENGKRIKTGMEALITPTSVKKEEFGSIRAKVLQVSLFPSNPEAMRTVLQNEDLVKQFTKQGSVIAVRVHLKTDPKTYSGYAWTSSQGPEQIISAGTLVDALITVQTQAPVSLIIPAFKTLLGE